jgi:hypothetical protein
MIKWLLGVLQSRANRGVASRHLSLSLASCIVVCGLVSSTTFAATMRLTIYDDGRSCPAECDAHVAINPNDNGTRYAYLPTSSRNAPMPCVAGKDCRICFDDADSSCMTVKYRGGGPSPGTFDFTPAFYKESCSRSGLPAALSKQCRELDAAVARLGYLSRIDCFEHGSGARCQRPLALAKSAQETDEPKRLLCMRIGEAEYNRRQTNPNERRAIDCNYSDLSLGGTPKKRWRVLLPAGCREGTYVGRSGLDCCSSDLRFAAKVHPECVDFFPMP